MGNIRELLLSRLLIDTIILFRIIFISVGSTCKFLSKYKIKDVLSTLDDDFSQNWLGNFLSVPSCWGEAIFSETTVWASGLDDPDYPLSTKLGKPTLDQLYLGSTLSVSWRGKYYFISVFGLPVGYFFYSCLHRKNGRTEFACPKGSILRRKTGQWWKLGGKWWISWKPTVPTPCYPLSGLSYVVGIFLYKLWPLCLFTHPRSLSREKHSIIHLVISGIWTLRVQPKVCMGHMACVIDLPVLLCPPRIETFQPPAD